jgi:phosphoglycerate kinase
MEKLSLRDLSVKNKRVLMRVDFNVPLKDNGDIADDSRILATLPSIHYVLDHGGALILMSHLGRPEGKVNKKYSLAPCKERLENILQTPVLWSPDCIGPVAQKMASNLKPGEILFLENLRFHEGEENPEKDPSFVQSLAKLGDLYVNDAFGTAHRAHSSTALLASFFPGQAAAGFLMEQEIKVLSNLLKHPKKPFYAIIGGAKVSSKVGVIQHLLPHIDALFIGGGMAYTFLKAQGIPIGNSPYEETESAALILQRAAEQNIPCHLPKDLIIADAFKNEAQTKIISIKKGIPKGWQGMGIGPKTVETWSFLLKDASTVFWNGPLGVFEMPKFAEGTFRVATVLARSSATVVVGGGDSVAAVQQMGLGKQFAHLSTGGGASLEFIELGHLPGIDSLSNKPGE